MKLTRQEFEDYIKEQNQTAIEPEPAPGKICPIMTRDLRFPITCQQGGCELWLGLGNVLTGHCGLRQI